MENNKSTSVQTAPDAANRTGTTGNLGEQVPTEGDNLLRMGAAALTGMSSDSRIEELSGGSNSFMAVGGSEGYTGAETSGGGADPYEEEEGRGTGSGVGSDAGGAGGGTGNDLAGESGHDGEADGGGGAGVGNNNSETGRNLDTSMSPGGLISDDE